MSQGHPHPTTAAFPGSEDGLSALCSEPSADRSGSPTPFMRSGATCKYGAPDSEIKSFRMAITEH